MSINNVHPKLIPIIKKYNLQFVKDFEICNNAYTMDGYLGKLSDNRQIFVTNTSFRIYFKNGYFRWYVETFGGQLNWRCVNERYVRKYDIVKEWLLQNAFEKLIEN